LGQSVSNGSKTYPHLLQMRASEAPLFTPVTLLHRSPVRSSEPRVSHSEGVCGTIAHCAGVRVNAPKHGQPAPGGAEAARKMPTSAFHAESSAGWRMTRRRRRLVAAKPQPRLQQGPAEAGCQMRSSTTSLTDAAKSLHSIDESGSSDGPARPSAGPPKQFPPGHLVAAGVRLAQPTRSTAAAAPPCRAEASMATDTSSARSPSAMGICSGVSPRTAAMKCSQASREGLDARAKR